MTKRISPLPLISDPNQYLFAMQDDQALFLSMDRDAYARSLFLDRRIVAADPRLTAMSVADLIQATSHAACGRIGWIFHVAHCGSTLLARALDHRDHSLVLREPQALRQLGIVAAKAPGGQRAPEWAAQLRSVAALMGRRYLPDAPVIVKANVPVNAIVSDLMALAPDAPAIFLYYPLAEYLMAVLRSPGHRQWVDGITHELAPLLVRWCGSLDGLDTFDRAAALWLAQLRIFADALDRYPNARALDAEQLFDNPDRVIPAAHAAFGIRLGAEALDAMLAGPLFGTYAKNPDVAFTNVQRRGRQEVLRGAMAERLVGAREWVAERSKAYPLPERLPQPLEATVSRPLV